MIYPLFAAAIDPVLILFGLIGWDWSELGSA